MNNERITRAAWSAAALGMPGPPSGPGFYAWAHALSPAEAVACAARFPGLGLVLSPRNYAAAPDLGVPPIAYVGSVDQAQRVAATGPWVAAIILDERNQTGPSGARMAPTEYAQAFEPIAAVLTAAGIDVYTMGLASIGNTWQRLTATMRFDAGYHAALPAADGRAWNPNKTRAAHIIDTLAVYPGKWILSPAPFRSCWDRAFQPVGVRRWAEISTHPDVTAVALWCLREIRWADGKWQAEHGLLDRDGDLTSVGRAVLAVLH